MRVLRYVFVAAIGLLFFNFSPPARSVAAINCYGGGTATTSTGSRTVPGFCEVVYDDGGSGSGVGGGVGSVSPQGGGTAHTSANKAPAASASNRPAPKIPCDKSGKQQSLGQVADPIIVSSGAKVDTITDFALPGEMGLRFERYYNSRFICIEGIPCSGAGAWTSNLDYSLDPPYCEFDPDVKRNICYPGYFTRPDGSKLYFRGGVSYSTLDRSSPNGTATLTTNADGTYTVVDEDSRVLTFDSQGTLQAIKDHLGIGWTLTHPDSNTVVVTHTNGQSFRLVVVDGSTVYGTPKQIRVTDPAGNVYVYDSTTSAYEAAATPVTHLGAIEQVTLPGAASTVITYAYYPDVQAQMVTDGQYMLLKSVAYNGVVHDTTGYDSSGRATAYSLADGSERTSIVYGSNGTGPTATVTSPLDHVNVYQYDSAGNLVSVTGNAALNCSTTFASMSYDANGFMTSSTDNNGNVTQYTYDANGLLQKKVEAAGTSVQRTTDYVWDSASGTDRLLSVTIEGWSKTANTYDAQGRVGSVAVTNLSGRGNANQTLTTSYTRTLYGNGLVHTLTVTHPSAGGSNKDVYTFDTLGRMTSAANGLGQTVVYSNYNALGEPGKVVGLNGDETDYTYDGRGRVVTKTTHPNGGSATWSFTYDGFGLPATETDPDGKITMWDRNATTMRVGVVGRTEKDGDSTETLSYNANGDVTSDVIQRGSDIGLSQSMSYDALGRLYKKTGMHGQVLTYGYDGNGNVASVTNAVGHTVSYQYDALNRVTRTTESGGSTLAGVPTISLSSSSTTGNYTVSWTGLGYATSYTLQEQVNGGGWTTIQTSSATSKAVSGKANGTYGYRVQGCNPGGCGGWSATSSVSVLHPPPAPASISVPGSSTGVVAISWPAASTATSYILQHALNGGGWSTVYSGAAASHTQSETVSGSYVYRVEACNASGCSVFVTSGAVSVTIPPATPSLSVPSASTTGSYSVSWGGVSGATSYTLQEQVNGGGWTTIQVSSATSRAISGKANGTYGYHVQACAGSVCGSWSGVKSVGVLHAPNTPTGLSATIDAILETDLRPPRYTYLMDATWSASSTATSYDFQYCLTGGSCTSVHTTSTSVGTGYIHGTSYSTNVRACNASGCSAWSAAVTPSVVYE